MDVRDSSSPSDLADFDQSHALEIIDKTTQLAPENVTTKSDSEKFVCSGKISSNDREGRASGIRLKTNRSKRLDDHKRNNGGIKSSLEDKDDNTAASSETNYFDSEDRLASVSNIPKKEASSHVIKTEPTCTNNEQCPLDMVVCKEVNESVEAVLKVVSTVEDTSDEFSKDLIKAEMEPSINGGEERKHDTVIPEFEVKSPESDDIVTEQACTSNCSKIEDENEAPNKQIELDASLSASEERMHAKTSVEQKNRKAEVKQQKPDSLRPLSRLLHDLGLDLVREQVYKDLIGIQVAKEVKNMLDDKEKEQLKRLTDAHSKLIVKNAVYQLPFVACRCNFSSSSANVLALHHEFGSTYEVPFHTCCLCEDCKTRWPSQFLSHLESSHQVKGRVQTKLAPNICRYCPYEHKNHARMEVHSGKCFKKFNLNTNLQPVPADCDIPLMGKPTSSQLLRPGMMAYPSGLSNFSISHGVQQLAKPSVGIGTASNVQPSVMEIGGQLYSLVHHNGKALFTSLRSQIANVSSHNSNAPSSAVVPANFPRFVQPVNKPSTGDRTSDTATRVPFVEKCEMCDAVLKDRDALWNHFRLLHKVELSRVSMIEKEPWMTCDVCLAKFWTYQGLTRHSVQLHKRELNSQGLPTKTFKCFLCLQTHANPLNHLSTFHNITLLDMYHSRRCCMCNKRFRSAPSFEEHMVLQHHDIFANKDVLCTVLQALSTALSLKRQEAMQHRAPNTASFSKVSPRGSSNFTPSSSGSLQKTISPAAISLQKNSPGTHTPNKVPTPNVAPTASTGLPEVKKRVKQSNEQSKGNDSGNTSKTSPKKSTEEDAKELNKLYKEYADIGRPILRSMRHRLSRNSSEKVVDDGQKDSMEHKEDEQVEGQLKSPDNALNEDSMRSVAETNSSDEPLPKRLCKEGSNNDKLNNYIDTNQQKQLQEINGESPT